MSDESPHSQNPISPPRTQAPLGGDEVVGRAVKIAGEALVAPGASLILDGKLGSGAMHVVGGMLARWAFGPVGWLLVAADSYTRSVHGKGIVAALRSDGDPE